MSPLLQAVSLSDIMRPTRLSLRFCSETRRGLKMPHPSASDVLSQAGSAFENSPMAYTISVSHHLESAVERVEWR